MGVVVNPTLAVIEARGGGKREGGTHVSDNYLNQYYSMKRPNDGLGSGGLSPFGSNLKHFLRPAGGLGSGGLSPFNCILKHFLRPTGGLGSGGLSLFGCVFS